MGRGENAQLAVDLFELLRKEHDWGVEDGWKGIAKLLLSCDVWDSKEGWQPFHGCVVYRERNDFKVRNGRENAVLRRARVLTSLLAKELEVPEENLCEAIGQYWRHPEMRNVQPHNPVGHGFRSLVTHFLSTYGSSKISYSEEVDPNEEFPGHVFQLRSENPKIDIVARRGDRTVALISTRWRYRHDRVDVVEEAHQYVPAATRAFPECKFYAVVGEFSAARLYKILSNCPPVFAKGIIDATVHFQPRLISEGLGENGRVEHLKSLAWLANETNAW